MINVMKCCIINLKKECAGDKTDQHLMEIQSTVRHYTWNSKVIHSQFTNNLQTISKWKLVCAKFNSFNSGSSEDCLYIITSSTAVGSLYQFTCERNCCHYETACTCIVTM